MSVTIPTSSVVTPAGTRRRPRAVQLRGPLARPQRLDGPAGRPVQPLAPALTGSVRLRASVTARPRAMQPALRLTDRGVALVVSLFFALALVSTVVLATLFFSVSDAPIGQDAPAADTAAVAVGGHS